MSGEGGEGLVEVESFVNKALGIEIDPLGGEIEGDVEFLALKMVANLDLEMLGVRAVEGEINGHIEDRGRGVYMLSLSDDDAFDFG